MLFPALPFLPAPFPLSPRNPHHEKSPSLPRNVWVMTVASFLTDVSSDMVNNLVPLFGGTRSARGRERLA